MGYTSNSVNSVPVTSVVNDELLFATLESIHDEIQPPKN